MSGSCPKWMAQYPEAQRNDKLGQWAIKYNRTGHEIRRWGYIWGLILKILKVGFGVEYDQNTLE